MIESDMVNLVRDLRSARHARTSPSLDTTAPPSYSFNAADAKPGAATSEAVAARWMQATGVHATATGQGAKLPSTPRLGSAACTAASRTAGTTQRRGSTSLSTPTMGRANGSKPRAQGLLHAAAALRAVPHHPVTSPPSAPTPPPSDNQLATGTTSRSPRGDRQTGRSPMGATAALHASALSSTREGTSSVRRGTSPFPDRESKAKVFSTPFQQRLYAHGEARVPQPVPLSTNNHLVENGSCAVSAGAANQRASARMGGGASAATDPTSSNMSVLATSNRTARVALSAGTSSAASASPAIPPHSVASTARLPLAGTETPSAPLERVGHHAWANDEDIYGYPADPWEDRGASNFWDGSPPHFADYEEQNVGASEPEMQAHRWRVAFRRWHRYMSSQHAYAALQRASLALGSRLVRARALRRWSALRIARQQNEIHKLHQVANWHLQTLLGATSDVGDRHDPVAATRKLLAKWSSALVTAAWNAWKAWLAEQRNNRIPQMQVNSLGLLTFLDSFTFLAIDLPRPWASGLPCFHFLPTPSLRWL